MERIGRAQDQNQGRQGNTPQAEAAPGEHHDAQRPNQTDQNRQGGQQHAPEGAKADKEHDNNRQESQRHKAAQIALHGPGGIDLEAGQAGIKQLFRPGCAFLVYDGLNLLINTPRHKLRVVHIGEEDIDGRGLAVRGDQILEINGPVGQRLTEIIQAGLPGGNLRDQRRRLDHIGNRVQRIGQAERLLDPFDALQGHSQPPDFPQDLGGIDVIGQ